MICCISQKTRACILYLLTTIAISLIIYSFGDSHLQLLQQFEYLQREIKHIMKQMTRLTNGDLKSYHLPYKLFHEWDSYEDLKKEMDASRKALDVLAGSSDLLTNQIDRVDFALESLGAGIAKIEGETAHSNALLLSSIFGMRLSLNQPKMLLNHNMDPGNCYAFQGNESSVVIKLAKKILIDSVGVGHILKTATPDGSLKTAPNEFFVSGLNKLDGSDEFQFGRFNYSILLNQSFQLFKFETRASEKHALIKFKFLTNRGSQNFTCVYRLSVYGTADQNELP